MLDDVLLLAADTSRSRVYAQALRQAGLLPRYALLVPNRTGTSLPGQSAAAEELQHPRLEWMRHGYDLSVPLHATLADGGVDVAALTTHDINSTQAAAEIGARPQSVVIYSGYGGVLVGAGLLGLGKSFLHVHGGYLPDYKGSTTNYYSLLAEGTMGASAIFLTTEIDCGPVLLRRKFSAPIERTGIDHLYDSAARAEVLVQTLAAYARDGEWPSALPENAGGKTYYVIHPVLKHLAILAGK
ncbi:MAG TPA: formyltransferase family protein [Rhodocyclaceae bacterium]